MKYSHRGTESDADSSRLNRIHSFEYELNLELTIYVETKSNKNFRYSGTSALGLYIKHFEGYDTNETKYLKPNVYKPLKIRINFLLNRNMYIIVRFSKAL